MRLNPDTYQAFNEAPSKELRLVLVIDFPAPAYLASHDDIPNLPANHITDVLRNVTGASQELKPQDARSTIGALTAELLDAGGALSALFRAEEEAGNGLRGRRVQLYRGGAGMDWADFRLEFTQQIDKSVTLRNGVYRLSAQDIQREMRKEVFEAKATTLAADFLIGDTTLTVHDASGISPVTLKASSTLYPGQSRYFLRLKYQDSFEIVSANTKNGNQFTAVDRGLFGTTEIDHKVPAGSDSESSIEVEEYIYLELPGPAMVYAILRGRYPDGPDLPAHWGLGISAGDVDVESFNNIGTDWFDPNDYTSGLIFRFDGLTRTDGKAFIEKELNRAMGAYLQVGADGRLRLKRLQSIQRTADYHVELNSDNVVEWGTLTHDLAAIRNAYQIKWAWQQVPGEDQAKFYRTATLIDADSVAAYGQTATTRLAFKGLNSQRHTASTIRNRFDALRDMSAGAPLKLQLTLLPSMDDIELGDTVRVRNDQIGDYQGAGALDRSFLVVRKQVDQRTGRVQVRLLGSSRRAAALADPGGDNAAELPNGWYTSAGSDFDTEAGVNVVGGVLQADVTLAGGTNARTVFYYLGDLTVPVGVTLTLEGNTEIRVRGNLQINGTIRCPDGRAAGAAGYLGTTFGGRRVMIGAGDGSQVQGFGAERVEGDNNALPILEIQNDAGDLVGIPADMRGSGGGLGGDALLWNAIDEQWDTIAAGGAGGVGGGSLVVVARGVSFGAGGQIDLSGADGAVGASALGGQAKAGSGGGGAPGCAVLLVDGTLNNFPLLAAGEIVAKYGLSPALDGDAATQGKAVAELDLGVACARAAFVPVSRDPYPTYTTQGSGTGVTGRIEVVSGPVSWTRAPNAGDWEPVDNDCRLDCTFVREGVDVARVARRLVRDDDGLLTISLNDHADGNLNVSRVTAIQVGAGTRALTLSFVYDHDGYAATVSQSAVAVLGSDSPIVMSLSKNAAIVQVDASFQGNLGPASGQILVSQGETDLRLAATVSIASTYQSTFELNTVADELFPGPKGAFRMTSISGQDAEAVLQVEIGGVTLQQTFDVTANIIAAPALSAYIPGGNIYEEVNVGTQQTAASLTAIVENGSGNYTYNWRVTRTIQGTAGSFTASINKTTRFESTGGPNQTNSWGVECEVTDTSSSDVVVTNERIVTVNHVFDPATG